MDTFVPAAVHQFYEMVFNECSRFPQHEYRTIMNNEHNKRNTPPSTEQATDYTIT